MKKYLLTYNINDGGSTRINREINGLSGEIESNNKEYLIKEIRQILKQNKAIKGCNFSWWYDISTDKVLIKYGSNIMQ